MPGGGLYIPAGLETGVWGAGGRGFRVYGAPVYFLAAVGANLFKKHNLREAIPAVILMGVFITVQVDTLRAQIINQHPLQLFFDAQAPAFSYHPAPST